MKTVQEYNLTFERARRRLWNSASGLDMRDFSVIAKGLDMSAKSVYNYCTPDRLGVGENLKTLLQIQEAVLKYKFEKNK